MSDNSGPGASIIQIYYSRTGWHGETRMWLPAGASLAYGRISIPMINGTNKGLMRAASGAVFTLYSIMVEHE